MPHTWISGVRDNVTEIKAVIFLLFHFFTYNFARFGRFACFGRLARFGLFVSLFRVLVRALFELLDEFRHLVAQKFTPP